MRSNGRVSAAGGGWRWSIVAVAVLAMGLAAVPAAQAKVPSRGADKTVGCANTKKAKIWWQGTKVVVEEQGGDVDEDWTLTQFAVDNRCQQWLHFTIMSDPHSGGDCCWTVQVAPGANFTKTGKAFLSTGLFSGHGPTPFFVVREAAHECVDRNDGYGPTHDVAKDGKVTSTALCPRKYPESESRSIGCPGSWDPDLGAYTEHAEGVWKVDAKKIIKLAAWNNCDFEMIFWWRTKDGRRISLWVDEHSAFDFWKAELDPMPLTTKDGKVFFIDGPRMSPTTADTAAYDENWRISEGRPYLWVRGTGG